MASTILLIIPGCFNLVSIAAIMLSYQDSKDQKV